MNYPSYREPPPPVEVWGLSLTPVTLAQTLELIAGWVADRTPRYMVTANVHYAMLAESDPRLGDVNRGAELVVADGMPLVWAARGRLPERVAGSDLVPAVCQVAAERGWRVYFYGAAPGIADEAARRLTERYPGLQVVGVESPPFRDLSPSEVEELAGRVRSANPDILVLAFAMPRGELWMAEHYRTLGAPVTIQAGATLDFVAGRQHRAPRWMQRVGLEWAYRFLREPRRLGGRYARNIGFVARKLVKPR
jgi:N-acetylglucosaminyldiphosphoundecaprenol N-acetyl-beta-D-mannosaminyltransferase